MFSFITEHLIFFQKHIYILIILLGPTVAPLTTLGMFEVEETKLHRDVFVSWQTIDPWQENGPDFTYEVRMFDNSNDRYVKDH